MLLFVYSVHTQPTIQKLKTSCFQRMYETKASFWTTATTATDTDTGRKQFNIFVFNKFRSINTYGNVIHIHTRCIHTISFMNVEVDSRDPLNIHTFYEIFHTKFLKYTPERCAIWVYEFYLVRLIWFLGSIRWASVCVCVYLCSPFIGSNDSIVCSIAHKFSY